MEAGARQLDDIPGSVDSNHFLGSRLDLLFLFFLVSNFSSVRRKLLGPSRVTRDGSVAIVVIASALKASARPME